MDSFVSIGQILAGIEVNPFIIFLQRLSCTQKMKW